MLQQQEFDLLVLDVNLADSKGLEILAFINKHAIPSAVIVVSSSMEFDVVTKAFRFGPLIIYINPLSLMTS